MKQGYSESFINVLKMLVDEIMAGTLVAVPGKDSFNEDVRRDTMEFRELIDDIEKICTTCDTCEPSCAAKTFKRCIIKEMELETALQQLVGEGGA